MKLSIDTMKQINADMQKEVDQQIKNYGIYVYVDNQLIDIDHQEVLSGQINIYLKTPFCAVGKE